MFWQKKKTGDLMNTITNISNYLNTHLNDYFTKLISNPKSIASLEESFPRLIKQMSVDTLSATLESIDDKYATSSERKRNYTIKDRRRRTMVTAFGTMTYRRRYYCNKETNSYSFYLDDLLELLPYKRCTPRVEVLILENLAKDLGFISKKV